MRQLLRTFQRTGSASATVKAFRQQQWKFPRHALAGPHKGEVLWSELTHSGVLFVLHNPCYAGAFTFGRSRQRRLPDGSHKCRHLPQEEWTTLIRNAHEGYLSWEDYEHNLQRLRENATSYGEQRAAPREGPALLQGLAICASCGHRMTVRYHQHGGQLRPTYLCQRAGIERAAPICQWIRGAALDAAVGELLVRMVTPMALELALQVHDELQARRTECDAMRRREVERARYECDLARRRYMQVDPDNRLVATRSRPNGTRSCVRTNRRSRTTRSSARPKRAASATPSARASSPWPRTSRGCGTIRAHRSASASAWCAC